MNVSRKACVCVCFSFRFIMCMERMLKALNSVIKAKTLKVKRQ